MYDWTSYKNVWLIISQQWLVAKSELGEGGKGVMVNFSVVVII